MTTIFERVTTALNTLSPVVPFALAPYKSTTDLPDKYLAYQVFDSPPEQHADDDITEQSYYVQVTIWSRSGLVSIPDVDGVMKTAGFQLRNKGRQLPQDQETGHYGLAKDYVYLE